MSIDLVLILDTSLSMEYYKQYYIDGINHILNTQKKVNPFTRVTFIQFSDNIHVSFNNLSLQNVPQLLADDIKTYGATALYDAIGFAIQMKMVDNLPVIFVVITDGEDNMSEKVDPNVLANGIRHLSRDRFRFMYIGGDQNASDNGRELGIENCVTFSSSEKSIKLAMDMIVNTIGRFSHELTGVHNVFMDCDIIDDVSDMFLNSLKI